MHLTRLPLPGLRETPQEIQKVFFKSSGCWFRAAHALNHGNFLFDLIRSRKQGDRVLENTQLMFHETALDAELHLFWPPGALGWLVRASEAACNLWASLEQPWASL